MRLKKSLLKWSLTFKVIPFAAGAVVVKFALHRLGWEVISLNPLFSGLLAATVFLLGFLISGVLNDYKESEKLPGELATSLEALCDEASILYRNKRTGEARECLERILGIGRGIRQWLQGDDGYEPLMERIAGLNESFAVIEPMIPPPFLTRMKQEQSALRRVVTRIHVIRVTSFVSSGYAIAEITSSLLIVGFVLAKIDPFYESLFFIGMITFLLTYMLALIRDLDDPFDYGGGGADEISLAPLESAVSRIQARAVRLLAERGAQEGARAL